MLSEPQRTKMAIALNATINIPYIPEMFEAPIFEKAVDLISTFLDENLPDKVKEIIESLTEGIDGIHLEELKENLIKMLNKKINIPLIGESREEEIIRFFVSLLCQAMKQNKNIDGLLGKFN